LSGKLHAFVKHSVVLGLNGDLGLNLAQQGALSNKPQSRS
jgi:hypothetical protein